MAKSPVLPAILAISALLAGCSHADSRPNESAPEASASQLALGKAVYETPLADGNSFTCATCHALNEPSSDGLRRPAHAIADAPRRRHWKNGKAPSFFDAVNSCVSEWMVATPWQGSDPQFVALQAFLESEAPATPAADLSYEIVAPPSDVSAGDAKLGQTLFNQSCVVCHGGDGLGSIRGPKVAGSVRQAAYIAGRIRQSGSQTSAIYAGLTGGVMPFWAKDRLSDDEVRDLVAFIKAPLESGTAGSGGAGGGGGGGGEPAVGGNATAGTGGAAGSGGAAGDSGSAGVAGADTGCSKTDPHVGWVADLGINTGEGQVSGFVTVVDDCTLELRDFSYDGNGIDVRVLGSKAKNFKPGFAIGPNIVNRVFQKETWRVTLPEGKKPSDLDWVAIWCVAAGANFGSGQLMAP